MFAQMRKKGGDSCVEEISLEAACRKGEIYRVLEEYIKSCTEDTEVSVDEAKKSSKKGKKRFPNVAGFCRYCGIGEGEYDRLTEEYPLEFERIQAVFEDEALNSEISPTILTAYMKRWIGYEKTPKTQLCDGQLKIIFDHDIMEDGK